MKFKKLNIHESNAYTQDGVQEEISVCNISILPKRDVELFKEKYDISYHENNPEVTYACVRTIDNHVEIVGIIY